MRTHSRLAGVARLVATVVTLVLGEVVLAQAGRTLPRLALDRELMSRTFEEAEPLAVAISALRLLALAAGAAMLVLTAAGIVARAAGAARLVTHLDRFTPTSLRRMLDGALGVGIAASIGLSGLPAAADPTPSPATTIRRLADAAALPLQGPGGTLRRLADAAPAAAIPPPTGSAPAATGSPPAQATPQQAKPPQAQPPQAQPQREVVVRPGDSFWRLAERHQARRLGRHPSDAEIVTCWKELIQLNRHRLADPGNPDLIFPGQTLQMPCP
ncbi:MAG: LysM peptidoglycan-binding domain-containing protein [Acidimicrobiales bacterium]